MATVIRITIHGKTAFVMERYSGQHKDINICQSGKCLKFNPGQADNCPTAQASFELSRKVGIVPIMACSDYEA